MIGCKIFVSATFRFSLKVTEKKVKFLKHVKVKYLIEEENNEISPMDFCRSFNLVVI